jgi:hypothetical protein
MYHMNIIRKQCKADSLPNHKQTHMLCRLYYHIKRNTLQSKVTTKQQIYIHYNILCRQCKAKSVELGSMSTNVPQNIIRRQCKADSIPNHKQTYMLRRLYYHINVIRCKAKSLPNNKHTHIITYYAGSARKSQWNSVQGALMYHKT